jgi:hypothetical protein
VKNLPVTLFRKLVPAFREPPVTLKVVSKAACDTENCPKPVMNIVHFIKSTNGKEEKSEHKFYAAFRTVFTISTCFQKSKPELHTFFSL